MTIRLLLALSENWTMIDPRDLSGQVQMAVEAEKAGFDGITLSEHVVMGKGADAAGEPFNPRQWVGPGNQHPSTPWPNPVVLMAGIAAATTRLRIVSAALIAPLRHPLLLAKEISSLDLLSEGRLVVLPTVSWHKSEYDALQVPFHRRGAILNEQLQVLAAAWNGSPTSFDGEFFQFDDAWVEPGPFRKGGPPLWFGGTAINENMLKRLATYGSGYMGLRPARDSDLARIAQAMQEAGRDISELEFVGGVAGRFVSPDSTADLNSALEGLVPQLAAGLKTFVIKPSQFLDNVSQLPAFLSEVRERVCEMSEKHGGVS